MMCEWKVRVGVHVALHPSHCGRGINDVNSQTKHVHSFGSEKRTTFWWLDNNATNGLISPLHLPARSRAPPIHTPLSEWAIIAPLISICCVLLMRGRPIDT